MKHWLGYKWLYLSSWHRPCDTRNDTTITGVTCHQSCTADGQVNASTSNTGGTPVPYEEAARIRRIDLGPVVHDGDFLTTVFSSILAEYCIVHCNDVVGVDLLESLLIGTWCIACAFWVPICLWVAIWILGAHGFDIIVIRGTSTAWVEATWAGRRRRACSDIHWQALCCRTYFQRLSLQAIFVSSWAAFVVWYSPPFVKVGKIQLAKPGAILQVIGIKLSSYVYRWSSESCLQFES